MEYAPPLPPNDDPAIQAIERLPYLKLRAFLSRQLDAGRERQYPRFLYKHKGIDLNKVDHLRDIVVRSRLFLSVRASFNDPFDTTANVIFEGSRAERTTRFTVLMRSFEPHLSPEMLSAKVSKFLNMPRSEHLARITRVFGNAMDECGIFSFGGNVRNILMWSHYADHHKGVCLQFEAARDPPVLLSAVRVRYKKAYPVFNWATSSTNDAVMDSVLSKFDCWQYERESRIVHPDGGKKYLRFNPAALTGVIIGCRASQAGVDCIRVLLAERAEAGLPRVRLLFARKHPDRYGLRFTRLPPTGITLD
jgi:hypothetical protein